MRIWIATLATASTAPSPRASLNPTGPYQCEKAINSVPKTAELNPVMSVTNTLLLL